MMRVKLLLFSMVLLALPWLGWRYLDAMQGFLLDGQRQAQALTARALATAMAAYPDEFAGVADDADDDGLLRYARPLAEFPLLDGYGGDWGRLVDGLEQDRDDGQPLRWIAATWGDDLYLLVRVRDSRRVYRHPSIPRLDTSDHLRLRLMDEHGVVRRLSLSADGPGEVRVEEAGPDWRYPLYGGGAIPVKAYWQEIAGGYQVEVRLPLDWGRLFTGGHTGGLAGGGAGGLTRWLTLGVVDVDDPEARIVESLWWTPRRTPGSGLRAFRLLARSPRLQAALSRDWQVDEVVVVVDRGAWVRAASEGAGDIDRLPEGLVGGALAGHPVVFQDAGDYIGDRGDSLVAVQPIRHQGRLLGAVMVRQGVAALRAAQWQAFQGIGIATLVVLLVLVLGLLLFATRIAWRLRRLGNETARAIDSDGRVAAPRLAAEARAGDEFGDLSRRISAMLAHLQHYTGFLESVPRTLRHEINNPLNTISTSLQNLVDTHAELRDDRYLRSAGRGVARLERIVNSLTEAAGLEQALRLDHAEDFDLAALVSAYTTSTAAAHRGRSIVYRGPTQGIRLKGNDFRIEQLLDKLVDNALDFTPEGGVITLSLETVADGSCLRVSNDGPPLPEAIRGRLFDSMVSVRDRRDGVRPHLGMGLFIAHTIAGHHRGVVSADNRGDGSGVVLSVWLPTPNRP